MSHMSLLPFPQIPQFDGYYVIHAKKMALFGLRCSAFSYTRFFFWLVYLCELNSRKVVELPQLITHAVTLTCSHCESRR